MLVTRPQPQADEWVARLVRESFDAQALPLLQIVAAPDTAAVDQAWAGLAAWDLLVFVSPNAVSHFFARRGAAAWPAHTLAAVPGPGSAAALARAGVPAQATVQPAADAAEFDSEHLWEQLKGCDWAGRRALVVRGDGGREFLADRLREAGAQVDLLQAYARQAPRWSAAERALLEAARRAPQTHLWLLSSSQALGHLATLAPGTDWAAMRALASHPRIAEAARAVGFGDVHQVPPGWDALLPRLRALAVV